MKAVDWILIFIFNFAVAMTLPFSKKALAHFEPFTMQGIKCLIILLFVSPFLVKLRKREMAGILKTSIFLFTGCYSLGAMAIQIIENQNAVGFVNMMEAPIAAILGIILLKEIPSIKLLFSLGLCLTGAAVVSTPSGGMEFIGFVFLACSIIFGGLGQVYLKKSVDSVPPRQAILWCYVFSVPQFFLLSIFEENKKFIYVDLIDIAIVAIMSLLAMMSWSFLLKRHTVSMLQPFYFLTAVTIPLSNYVVLGQTLSSTDLLGAAFILLGVALISVRSGWPKIVADL